MRSSLPRGARGSPKWMPAPPRAFRCDSTQWTWWVGPRGQPRSSPRPLLPKAKEGSASGGRVTML